MDSLEGESHRRFLMHYNFPPFSVGETSPLRGPGRREIGHGALAERALVPMIPTEEAFPYTILAWFPTFWNPTAPPRWQLSAAQLLR